MRTISRRAGAAARAALVYMAFGSAAGGVAFAQEPVLDELNFGAPPPPAPALLTPPLASNAPAPLANRGPAPLNEVPAPINGAPAPKNIVDNGLAPGVPAYRPTLGPQTASLTVDWVTPESVLIGQEGLFELVLRNRGRAAMEGITIEEILPEGFRLVRSDPQPEKGGAQPIWRIKRLDAQQEYRIALRLIPTKVGDFQSHARVHFNTASLADFKVVEPKLAMEIEAPASAIVGNQAILNVTVKNPGSGKTTNAAIKIELPPQLVGVTESPVFQLGSLNPGEARSVRIPVRVTAMGKHTCKLVATADHGLKDEGTRQIAGLSAVLNLDIAGPNLRYVTRPATYTVTLKNAGTAPAHNVNLQCVVPKAFAYVAVGETGRFDHTRKTLNWTIPNLDVGGEFKTTFTLRAENRGEYPILGEAIADRGIGAKAQHLTTVEGIAAILLEVVDVDDPIEIGAETSYEIIVTNQGTDFAKDVRITAIIPPEMQIVGVQGPSREKIDGQTIRFESLPKLAPLADAIYRVRVRGLKAADCRLEVRAEAESLESPVAELESTKVYSDR